MLTYVLFMVVIKCHFPQFADGLENSEQAWGLLRELLNLVDLNLQVVHRFFSSKIVKSGARYTSRQIADMVGISKAFALSFCRNILKKKKESTWWAPDLLNEKQKYAHVRTAHKLLKQFPRYDQRENIYECSKR